MIADAPKSVPEILNSWKEIAVYLNRGVRTVQRWEIELGLPVRRPRGRRHSAVIAKRSELDAWMASCPLTPNGDDDAGGRFTVFNRSGLGFLLTEIQTDSRSPIWPAAPSLIRRKRFSVISPTRASPTRRS